VILTERDEARFWSKVAPADANGCRLWTAGKCQGYGSFRCGVKIAKVHRISYELAKGPIPEGLVIDHLCRVRHCVAPEHLEAVTSAENVRRSPVAPSVVNAAKTHCLQGHPYDEANTYVTSHGYRSCRTCRRAWRRTWKQRHAAS